jgi:hypothetical protein
MAKKDKSGVGGVHTAFVGGVARWAVSNGCPFSLTVAAGLRAFHDHSTDQGRGRADRLLANVDIHPATGTRVERRGIRRHLPQTVEVIRQPSPVVDRQFQSLELHPIMVARSARRGRFASSSARRRAILGTVSRRVRQTSAMARVPTVHRRGHVLRRKIAGMFHGLES